MLVLSCFCDEESSKYLLVGHTKPLSRGKSTCRQEPGCCSSSVRGLPGRAGVAAALQPSCAASHRPAAGELGAVQLWCRVPAMGSLCNVLHAQDRSTPACEGCRGGAAQQLLRQELPLLLIPSPWGEGHLGKPQRVFQKATPSPPLAPLCPLPPKAVSPQQQHQGQEQQRRTHRDPSSATAVLGIFLRDGDKNQPACCQARCHLREREQCLRPKHPIAVIPARAQALPRWSK